MVHCLGRRAGCGAAHGDREEITMVAPGVSLSIPLGTQFQFRCDGAVLLLVIGVTMPTWPGGEEAAFVHGLWQF